MATTTWCLQCGATNRPELAIGVDEDGEPACALHCEKPARPAVKVPPMVKNLMEAARSASPQRLDQDDDKETSMERATCAGFERECSDPVYSMGYCQRCYHRYNYRLRHPLKGKAKAAQSPRTVKTNGHASEQPRKKSTGGASILAAPHVPVPLDLLANLALLKQDLRTKIEAVELVEALCRLQQLREATVTEASQ